jgi:hypothetical protein
VLSTHRLEQFLTQIHNLARPVVTIYAQTGAQSGAVSGGSLNDAARIRVCRVFAQLRERDKSIVADLEEQIITAMGFPVGRGTVAIFAGRADGKRPTIITRNLPVELPVGTNGLAAEGRVGEPWLEPLRLALSETERVGVIHVHDHGVTLHEVFLAEIERVLDLTPPTMPGEDDHLQTSKNIHPAHVADRGGAGYDDAEAHRVAWRRRFYVDAAVDLLAILTARSIAAVILIGTPGNRQLFNEVAPAPLTSLVIGTGPGLPQQDARPPQILDAVRETIDDYIRRRKLARLEKLQEQPVLGLDDCLTRLQRGQLELLFVPWDLDGELFVELASGQVATSPGQARALSGSTDAAVEPVPARTKLLELADAYSTSVEFIRRAASASPFDAIRGVAGVLRWS